MDVEEGFKEVDITKINIKSINWSTYFSEPSQNCFMMSKKYECTFFYTKFVILTYSLAVCYNKSTYYLETQNIWLWCHKH